MAPPLSHDLARTLGIPPPEAERLLARVAEHLRNELAARGQVRVEGLGTFRREGFEVTFEPEPTLAQSVNHRYAGLGPVPTETPLDEPVWDEDEPDLTPPPTTRTATPSDTAPEPSQEEPEDPLDDVWTPPVAPPDDEHPLGPRPPDQHEDADFTVEHDASLAPPPSPAPAPETMTEAATPPASSSTTTSSAPVSETAPVRDASPEQPRRRRGAAGVLVAALALLLVGLAAVWLLSPRPTPPPEPVAVLPAPPPEPEPDPEPAPEAEAEPEAAPAEEARNPALWSSEGVDPARGGVTWIVASRPSRADAERIAASYRERGYRVSVLPHTQGGRTTYRVAVGQFATNAEALEARDLLPPDAPEDTWRLVF